jgi:hypothetical protein
MPFFFGPARVHPHQHRRPVAGLGPARAGIDAQDRAVLVVRAAQELLEFQELRLLGKLGDFLVEVLEGLRVGVLGDLEKSGDLRGFLLQLEEGAGVGL